MTDLGFTGGGAGVGKMYLSGRADHNVANGEMIDHIVGLVEQRAAEMKTAREAAGAAPSASGSAEPAHAGMD
jgi:(E)-4-hydroxy-3-methylbut-2-enyl-diphosphate synthase